MSLEKVKAYFQNTEFDGKILEFNQSSATVELAAKALNCEPDRIAKTLSFLVDEQPVIIVVSGMSKIDNGNGKVNENTKKELIQSAIDCLKATNEQMNEYLTVFKLKYPNTYKNLSEHWLTHSFQRYYVYSTAKSIIETY